MYPHVCEVIPVTRFYVKNTGQFFFVYLPYQFHAAENTVCQSRWTVQPFQSFHNSTANFRVHASVTFLVGGDEKPFLMAFLLECCWQWFGRCVISRLSHAYLLAQNVLANGVDAMFSSGNFRETSSASLFFAHMQSTPKNKSAYFHLSRLRSMSKMAFISSGTKSVGYSRKKSERPCLL